jgi:hypothetical protein
MDDETEIATVLARFLRAVSFGPGASPNYGALRDMFSEGARLIKNSGAVPEISTVNEFIASRHEQAATGRLTSFEEIEVADITDVFGNIAHRLSTYDKRGTLDGVEFAARGVISTQFIRTPEGWRISAMAWDDERPGLTLPHRYQPGP